MQQEMLKTSRKQRFFIGSIAVVMIFTIIASYALIVVGNNASGRAANGLDQQVITAYYNQYNEKKKELNEVSAPSFDEFMKFKSEIKAFNEASANSDIVTVKDLKKGNGRKLGEEDYDYYAYYVGWCGDETIFDSTFDNTDNPTAFSGVLEGSANMIQGWNDGIVGMHLGGIRKITIPGDLAYGDSQEICGGYNKPLKFIVMLADESEKTQTTIKDYLLAEQKYLYAVNYGIDYDAMFGENSNVVINGE